MGEELVTVLYRRAIDDFQSLIDFAQARIIPRIGKSLESDQFFFPTVQLLSQKRVEPFLRIRTYLVENRLTQTSGRIEVRSLNRFALNNVHLLPAARLG